MISSSHLNKLVFFIILLTVINSNLVFAEDEPIDIWENTENQNSQNETKNDGDNLAIESPIISGDINKINIKINENKIEKNERAVIGIFDPEENNFNLSMWVETDGGDIKKVLARINKLKLSDLSENLLFEVLFTNAYAPKKT